VARLAGVDVGTSGTKAVLVDDAGKVLAQSSAPHTIQTPRPGWAEQDPEEWVAAARACLEGLGEAPDAVAFAGQMHGSVFVGAEGRALRPALLWCDQRTALECAELASAAGEGVLAGELCNAVSPGLQAPKAMWLRRHEPGVFAETRRLLLPKDYVAARLYGVEATDAADAAGTGLFDVRRRAWSARLAEAAQVPGSWLPPCYEPGQPAARLEGGVLLVAGAGDQSAGAVGVGAVVPGTACVSLGSSGVALTPTEAPEPGYDASVNRFCHADGRWLSMGVMLSCAASLAWARGVLAPSLDYEAFLQTAEAAPARDDGPVFLPYLSGERCPVVAPEASGAFLGLRAGDTAGDLARAVVEGVTFGLADCADLAFGPGRPESVWLTGGGAASDFWCQYVADALGARCVVPECEEGPAFGAALLAGVGLGVWPDAAGAAAATVRPSREFWPSGRDLSQRRARFVRSRPAGLGDHAARFAIQS
jgi:xylulokinase